LSGSITLNTTFPISGDTLNANTTFAAEQLALWEEGSADSLYTAPNNAVAYVNLTVSVPFCSDIIPELTFYSRL